MLQLKCNIILLNKIGKLVTLQAPAVDLRLTVWPSRLARLGYLKRDETSSILSRCLKRDETSSISRDLTVMTVSNRLTGRFLILNGHGQKIMNRDEIKRDENGQNMFDRRCLTHRESMIKKSLDKLNNLGLC